MLKLLVLAAALLMFSQAAFAYTDHTIYSDGSQEINSSGTTHYYGSDGSYQGSSYTTN